MVALRLGGAGCCLILLATGACGPEAADSTIAE